MTQRNCRLSPVLIWGLPIVVPVLLCGCSLMMTDSGQVEAEGFVELFNGEDLTGWSTLGPGVFTVEDGALRVHGGAGSMGFLWYDQKKFRDFVLRVEWKVATVEDDSGVFVRFPNRPQTPRQIETEGYEIQIYDSWDLSGTGALIYLEGGYHVEAADKAAAKKPGEWNCMDITVIGQHYSVVLNGEKVLEFDGNRGREGYIALQGHSKPVTIHFRGIRIKELTEDAAAQQ